jgi:hypothetical protein
VRSVVQAQRRATHGEPPIPVKVRRLVAASINLRPVTHHNIVGSPLFVTVTLAFLDDQTG